MEFTQILFIVGVTFMIAGALSVVLWVVSKYYEDKK